ncbi:uncharacterized protein LOC109791326 [Cajanus cajan]|uniref:uncharacterized protein LOC109791326 n=1 Tax=Cajanus cajan TaxID=3821 RepID=UPI00098DB57D|nr:uncharacterized protein LOC109791326 [Cajanus cajan]
MDKSNGCCFSSVSFVAVFSSTIFIVSLILVRLLYVIYCRSMPLSKRSSKPVVILWRCLIYWQCYRKIGLIQDSTLATDNMSLQKAQLLENSLAAENATRVTDTTQFMKIFRTREVAQTLHP